MFVIFSVFYILIAAAMIVLILMQRGAGADAGSGFGAGASATVFGARGSANFLSRATAVLATLFFLLSLGMGIYLKVSGAPAQSANNSLGVMAGVGNQPAKSQNAQPTKPAESSKTAVPAATSNNSDVPAAPATKPASTVPSAPVKH
ncbi:preprotein translocase subunit SecG [Dyella sp. A6]|uniref:preprotein translocase subunit SecG n=1 Tax=Dyella aluminiiresistens TaxID=3069105 RepID=UPI002E7A2682|nr:preprotein translocase subunit SecG [Dyella sp. A6]